MRAEKVIFALLSADAGVQALVGAGINLRLYPARIPQNPTWPALVYETTGADEVTPMDAQAGYQIVRTRVQVTALARNYSDVKALLEAVRKACLYKSGLIATVQVLSVLRDHVGPDQFDADVSLYMQSVDFIVTHYET